MCLKVADYSFKPQTVIDSLQCCGQLHAVYKLMLLFFFSYSLDYANNIHLKAPTKAEFECFGFLAVLQNMQEY
jgi:hypothetical protein